MKIPECVDQVRHGVHHFSCVFALTNSCSSVCAHRLPVISSNLFSIYLSVLLVPALLLFIFVY